MFASYSCVQDKTEDLAPVVSGAAGGSEGVSTLQVSMPVSSRTALGEKTDGKYPVSWCESDVLAVNGKPTTSITINESAPNVAVFKLPLGITIPYSIVYPYPGEGVVADGKDGKYPVVFASEQMHTEGTFAQNSAPMYAWSNGFDDVHMEHLATALRFSIKAKAGESVNLKYVSVSTVAAEPISGLFDVYCTGNDEAEAGTIVARESSISTVFYNFEGGSYTLSDSKADVFYIAVPKGEYTRFEVNFVTQSGEVCSETFDASGDKKLEGGKVREFPTVEFVANSKMLLIGSDVDMETFASEVKAGTFNEKYDGALLVSNIDMSGKSWSPVEGFTSVFEGRNFKITGLSAPLFGENVVATISNVVIEANLVEEACGKVGLIARSLAVDGDKVGTIFNCSAVGSINYQNDKLAVNENFDLINVGGLVGGVYGGSVTLSESNVDVTISVSAGAEGKDKAYTPCIGGIVGYVCASGDVLPVVSENVSNGAVVWDDVSGSTKVTPFIGGVAGYVVAGTFTDNVNTGKLSIREAMYDLDWGGVIGASAVSVERCENKGSLEINEAITKANIGGVLGKLEANSIVGCENSGKLLFDTKFEVKQSCNIGGVVAYTEKGTKNVINCANSGSITYLGKCYYADRAQNKGNGNANMRLGGIVGLCWSQLVSGCENKATANIDIQGEVAGVDGTNEQFSSIAAIIGSRCGKQSALGCDSKVRTENCTNAGKISCKYLYCGYPIICTSACIGLLDSDEVESCNNTGTFQYETSIAIDVNGTPTTTRPSCYVAGLIAYVYSTCDLVKDCNNEGTIIFDNAQARGLNLAGILGYARSGAAIKLTNCTNRGNVIAGSNAKGEDVYIGGILANTSSYTSVSYPNCSNHGNVESKAEAINRTFMGSIFGQSKNSNPTNVDAASTGVYNEGTVTYAGKSKIAYIGGYCGLYIDSNHTVEFNNTASGVVKFDGSATEQAHIGGYAGRGELAADGEFKVHNYGNIAISGYAPIINVGGALGSLTVDNKPKGLGICGLSNSGTVEILDDEDRTIYPDTFYAGGIIGYAAMSINYPTTAGGINTKFTINDCNNSGDILYKGIARDGAYIGGIVGCSAKAPIYNCENSGKIVSTGHAGDASPKQTQSEDKHQQNGWAYNYKNHDLAIGGIVGETDFDMSGCVNRGEITHTCILNPLKIDHNGDLATSRFDIGGVIGRTFTPYSVSTQYSLSLSGLENYGAVTIYGTPSATNNTASIDLSDSGGWEWTDVDDNDRTQKRLFYRVNVAGLLGRMMDNSSANVKNYMNACVNHAPVSIPEAAGAKCLNIAGAVGDLLVSNADFNNVVNEGRISIDKAGVGTSTAGSSKMEAFYITMSGIVGLYFDSRVFAKSGNYKQVVNFNDCENKGNIHYGEIAASVYQCAGGILGQALHLRGDHCIGNNGVYAKGESYTGSGERYSCIDVHFNRCKNSGSIDYLSTAMNLSSGYNYNYAGGILGTGNIGHAGYTQNFNSLDLTFDHCENSGSIQWDRNNTVMSTNANPYYTAVGGIVGHYCGGMGVSTTSTSYSTTGRTVSTTDAFNAQIISCKNSGRIHGFSGYLGGIVGAGYWYIKITGTEDDPTINTGDIVVMRDASNKVVVKNRYGNKYMYAGGIVGHMAEFTSAAYAVANSGNNSYPAYLPENQYARIEYAINEGAVGATGFAGGIAGYYYSAVEASKAISKAESRGGLEFCRNTGDIYALEGATINVGSIVGMARMFTYTSNTGNTVSTALSEGLWPIGVKNCYVGGSVLRGAVSEIKVNDANYMQAIYGENWLDEYVSTESKPFDGCVLYVPAAPEETPEGGEENE